MRRPFFIDRLNSERLDNLLGRLGFVYGITTDGETRYRIGDFMKAVATAKVFLSEDKSEAVLNIRLPKADDK